MTAVPWPPSDLFVLVYLQDYLQAKGLSLGDVLQTCCTKLDAGEYTCSGKVHCGLISRCLCGLGVRLVWYGMSI